MASRSDQLHSHQFMLRRVVGALAMRDPDPASSPLRRIGGALFAGIMVAALALAAVGVYGVLRPGVGDSWRTGNTLVIEEETGARFIYRDGVLHPVVNYSSALLILGAAEPTRARVPRSSLVGVPRGAVWGIPGAPDLLPGANDLLTTGWTLCSRAPGQTSGQTSGQASAGSSLAGSAGAVGDAAGGPAESVLLVGTALSGTGLSGTAPSGTALSGTALSGTAPSGTAPSGTALPDAGLAGPVVLLGQRGLIVRDTGGVLHLLWNNRRYAITDPDLVLAALAWPRQGVVSAATALLNAVPAGADLGRLRFERADRDSPVPGLRVGQVFVVTNQSGGRQFGVAQSSGLAEITPVQADLLIADGANGLGGKPTEIGQAQYLAAAKAPSLVPTGDAAVPSRAPEPMSVGPTGTTSICASFTDGAGPPEVTVVPPGVRMAGERRTTGTPTDPAAPVDWIAVPPGRGVLVEALAGAGSPNGALALVTDVGLRYPAPSRDVLGTLGYGGAPVVRLPAALVALLPSGPALAPPTSLPN